MLVFFFPFLKISAVTYTTACARVRFLFLKGISAAIFSLRSCTACARVLSLCMLARRARGAARDGLAALGVLGGSMHRKVDKFRVADKKQTNQQTNKHTLLFYRYRCSSYFCSCSLLFIFYITISPVSTFAVCIPSIMFLECSVRGGGGAGIRGWVEGVDGCVDRWVVGCCLFSLPELSTHDMLGLCAV